MHLSLSLLGSFKATVAGQPLVASRAKRIEALLAYLVMEADRPHRREALVGLLFSNISEEMARVNLRQTLTRLRRVIKDGKSSPPFLLLTRETIQFNVASDYSLDVLRFGALLRGCEAHQGQRNDHCPDCLYCVQEAVALYQGPFLSAFFLSDSAMFETWAQMHREQLHQAMLGALQIVADYYERRGQYTQAIEYTQRLLTLAPWEEGSHRRAMRLWAHQGQRSRALAQYKLCRQVLWQELGVQPSAKTEMLATRIAAAAEKRPHNLPPAQGCIYRPFC